MTLAVFDLDGTLIDSYRDIAGALNEVLAEHGHPTHDPEAVKRMIGGGVSKLLFRGLGGRAELIDAARARFRDAYAARLTKETRPYDGIREMLATLEGAGIEVAIATNKPSFYTEPIIEALHLPAAAVACADEVANRKPDPAVVALAIERAGADDALAYVGDMPVDVQTAQAAGLYAVGVTWGFDPDGMRAAEPDAVAPDPSRLGAMLLSLLGAQRKQGQASE